jgi:hypothetical protein
MQSVSLNTRSIDKQGEELPKANKIKTIINPKWQFKMLESTVGKPSPRKEPGGVGEGHP